jgi:AraC family transcriptional activator of mtrCDE
MRYGLCRGTAIHPILRVPEAALDNLLRTLEVSFVTLSECLVSPGWRLAIPAHEMPGVHYNIAGTGFLTVGEGPPVALEPHTLIIIPPRQPFKIDVPSSDTRAPLLGTVETPLTPMQVGGGVGKNVAGESDPQIIMTCGYFRAFYGASIDLFASMGCPIVERFEEGDQLGGMLKAALAEFGAQEVGAGAMTSALLKQVLVKLLRRSLVSAGLWVERFSILSDPQLARAFSDMVARPGAPHSVQTLSQIAGLSRSIFMARFVTSFGRPPMTILRELRMRQASLMLDAGRYTVDQIAHKMGYRNRTTFLRAFQKAYGKDLSEEKVVFARAQDREHRHTFAVPGNIRFSGFPASV